MYISTFDRKKEKKERIGRKRNVKISLFNFFPWENIIHFKFEGTLSKVVQLNRIII